MRQTKVRDLEVGKTYLLTTPENPTPRRALVADIDTGALVCVLVQYEDGPEGTLHIHPQVQIDLGLLEIEGPDADDAPEVEIDMQAAREMVALDRERDEIEGRLKAVKQRMEALDEKLKDQFAASGTQSMKVMGRTLYLRRDIRCSAKKGLKAEACAMLVAAGLESYVEKGFNANSVSAWMREEDREGRPLPEAFREVMNVIEEYHIRCIG